MKKTIIKNKRNIISGPQDPTTNQIHRIMIEKPYKWHSVKELCDIVFREFTKSHDTAIREAIRKIRLNADWFCLIISSRKGYKVCENREEFKSWRSGVIAAFETDLDVLAISDWKSQHDENMRMTETDYQCPVYEAIKDMPPTPQIQPPISYNIRIDGQVAMELN